MSVLITVFRDYNSCFLISKDVPGYSINTLQQHYKFLRLVVLSYWMNAVFPARQMYSSRLIVAFWVSLLMAFSLMINEVIHQFHQSWYSCVVLFLFFDCIIWLKISSYCHLFNYWRFSLVLFSFFAIEINRIE